jgi:hypothetical protein
VPGVLVAGRLQALRIRLIVANTARKDARERWEFFRKNILFSPLIKKNIDIRTASF